MFSLFASVFSLARILVIGIPLFGLAIYGSYKVGHMVGGADERTLVAKAAQRDAEQWAEWLVKMAEEDAEFATALEKAFTRDRELERKLDDAISKTPDVGVCLSDDFLRELGGLRP